MIDRMLRAWFNEPKRVDSGALLDAFTAMRGYRELLAKLIAEHTPECGKQTRYELWTRGLANALDELEQSVYCAGKFSASIKHTMEEKMDPAEKDDYYRYIYFYKNGLIRLFSVLDKLGYFLNDLLRLKCERVKPKFSYYTVLRQMKHLHAEPGLFTPLNTLKESCSEPMNRLRQKRNMEIHLVNTEMLDDLLHIDACRADRSYIENVSVNMDDLTCSLEMVCKTIATVFAYLNERKKTG
ncbi:MAG: hypothetical protein K0Q59_1761 [Paenibacillus sp.]|nr:hypothetical protein [Paenibacillus sp.]